MFRDVPIEAGKSVVIEVAPGSGGVAVLNGLQIISRGSGPPKTIGVAAPPPPATHTWKPISRGVTKKPALRSFVSVASG